MDKHIDPNRCQIDQMLPTQNIRGDLPTRKVQEPFLKGPITLRWLESAAHKPGKALAAALAIRLQHGISKEGWFKVDMKFRAAFNVSRYSWARALKQLKACGLIDFEVKRGRCARIRVIEPPDSNNGGQP